MTDEKIIELFFRRDEQAVRERENGRPLQYILGYGAVRRLLPDCGIKYFAQRSRWGGSGGRYMAGCMECHTAPKAAAVALVFRTAYP